MENNEKSYEILDKSHLGLGVQAKIYVTGSKVAAFTQRVKNAVSAGYHKAINKIKETAVGIKNAAVETKNHALNSIDAHAYSLAQEDYQKIMNKKTAKLDDKIANLNSKMAAIQNATIGLGKNQVVSEKERAYLLHRASELRDKYMNDLISVQNDNMQLENYQKGQSNRMKISGKRKILIGALDLKRIVTNVGKATKKGIVGAKNKIAQVASASMNKMKNVMNERKQIKQEKLQAEAKAREIAERNARPVEEQLPELDKNGLDAFYGTLGTKTSGLLRIHESLVNYLNDAVMEDEYAKLSPQGAALAQRMASEEQNDFESEIEQITANYMASINDVYMKYPEYATEMTASYDKSKKAEAEAKQKATETADKNKENDAYNRGYDACKQDYEARIAALEKQLASKNKAEEQATPSKEKETVDYNAMKKAEIVELAKEAGIKIDNSMKKADYIDALKKARNQIQEAKKSK